MMHKRTLIAASTLWLLAASLTARAADTPPPPPPPYEQDAGQAHAATEHARPGEHDVVPGSAPFEPGHPGGHAPGHPAPPPLAVLLEPALSSLALDSKQQSLWLKAEQADASETVARHRGMQQTGLALHAKLADTRLSLSQALRAATQASPGLRPAPQWLAFFDSLDAKQASLVRQMLQSAPQPPHGTPPLPPG